MYNYKELNEQNGLSLYEVDGPVVVYQVGFGTEEILEEFEDFYDAKIFFANYVENMK